MSAVMSAHETVRVRHQGDVCYLQMYRPDSNNTINDEMVRECAEVLDDCARWAKVVVLEGLPDVFCFGADLRGMRSAAAQGASPHDAQALYALWLQLKRGPFVSVAHVRGKANAGGVGFAVACDIVLCDQKASFSLSELLFGLLPACVLPFLIDRVGRARAHTMTLMTQPVVAQQALAWGLADACDEDSDKLLRMQLLRLRLLPKDGIARHKRYMASLDDFLEASRAKAVACNKEVFSDAHTLSKIDRYLATGEFPWQQEAVR